MLTFETKCRSDWLQWSRAIFISQHLTSRRLSKISEMKVEEQVSMFRKSKKSSTRFFYEFKFQKRLASCCLNISLGRTFKVAHTPEIHAASLETSCMHKTWFSPFKNSSCFVHAREMIHVYTFLCMYTILSVIMKPTVHRGEISYHEQSNRNMDI